MTTEHKMSSKTERVQKLISEAGICSRRKAEEKIALGNVTVNGEVITLGDKATKEDVICVDGNKISWDEHIYLMLNKPVGCVCSLKDPKYPTIMKYVSADRRIYPVGRLDFNTSGILLITSDGNFAQQVAHPSNRVQKKYKVNSFKQITDTMLKALTEPITLDDGLAHIDAISRINANTFSLTIHDGRNRIVRRICKQVNIPIRSLQRTAIGNIALGNIPSGKTRYLTQQEINSFFKK